MPAQPTHALTLVSVPSDPIRDKFMSSGQNVAVKGTTVGYYLFRRCPDNRADASH